MGILKDIKEAYQKAKVEFGNLALGHEAEFNEQIDLATAKIDQSKYDVIDITGVDPNVIERINTEMRGRESLMKKVVLNDFIFRLKDSVGVEVSFMAHCYHKKSPVIDANDGKRYRRFLDLYLLGESGDVYNVCQIVLVHNKFPIRYQVRRVAYRHGKRLTTYRAGAIDRYRILKKKAEFSSSFEPVMESIDTRWGKMAEYAAYHYLFALHEMVNCPERFTESNDGSRRIFKGVNVLPSRPKVIKPTRTISSSAPTSTEDSDERAIKCPYWTVRGHYRTLKSGKKIWIAPYVKGKERNNPDFIVAKTYDLNRKE